MSDHGLPEYKKIMTEILRLMKEHLATVADITDPADPRWKQIVESFERIEREAPESLKRYAGDMVLLHVDELERKWRK